MIKEAQRQFFDALKEKVQREGIEVKYVAGAGGIQIGDGLLMFAPLGDAGVSVLIEAAFCRFYDGLYFVQFHTTIVSEAEANAERLPALTTDVNCRCPIGAFGVLADAGKTEVYHRYCILADDESDLGDMVYESLRALTAIFDVVGAFYKEIVAAALPAEAPPRGEAAPPQGGAPGI
jgi:hypothetical protein